MTFLPATRPSDVHSYEHPALPELLGVEQAASLAVLCICTWGWWRAAGGAFQGNSQSPFTHSIFWLVELQALTGCFGTEADGRNNPVWNAFQ